MILGPEGVRLLLLCRGVSHVYHVHCFYLGGRLLLTPGIWLVNLFVIAITRRSFPLMFGVEPASLFQDPTASVGVIGWLIGVAMNLAGSIQYLV